MAENDKPATPEQQLLKLIEGQGKAGAEGASAKGPGKGAPVLGGKGRGFQPANLFKSLAASLSFWKRKQKKKTFAKQRRFSFGIAEINKALTVAAVVLFVYVVFDAVASARNLQKPPNFAPMKDSRAKAGPDEVKPLEEVSYFMEKISSRDIFREGKKVEAAPEAAPSSAAVAETAEAVQSLALVGISWSSNPDAIIEDKAIQRTYFVKRGQEVGDGVKVEAIFKDHVVVTYQDREYELR